MRTLKELLAAVIIAVIFALLVIGELPRCSRLKNILNTKEDAP